jgi:hypothetical protein
MRHSVRRYLGPCHSGCEQAFEFGMLLLALHNILILFDTVQRSSRNPDFLARWIAFLSTAP